MKNQQSNQLFEPLGFIRQGYSAIIANAGKVIAVITLLVAVLVTFTDIAFSDITSQSFTTSMAVMLISSYLMYFSLEDAGEKEGEESEEYKNSNARYLAVRARITPDCIEELRKFCLDYSRKECEYRRACFLGENGLGSSDFEAYKSGARFKGRALRVLRRADRIKAVNLTPAVLLNRNHGVGKSELLGPGKDKIFSTLTSLIPSTVCTVFTVSIILTAKDGLTPESVIEGILKLSALPIVGFRGMLDGYKFSRESKASWLETKARILESFVGDSATVKATE